MSEETKKSKNPFSKWIHGDPIRAWYYRNLKAISSNIRYRLIFLVLDGILVLFLFYLLSYTGEYTRDLGLATQLLAFGFYGALLFLPLLYAYRSGMQILLEGELNISICSVRREIHYITKEKKDFRALQVKINNLHRELKDFIDFSEVISPPIYSYELNRLHRGIDIFFNSVSEVLFTKPNIFSRAQKIEEQQYLDYYESFEHPTTEEIEAQELEMLRDEAGIITWFSLYALDEFLQYLGDSLFTHTSVFSPFSFKHSIDLITLSRFFDHWNSVVSTCRNCRRVYEKSRKDIEEYYKTIGEKERLQRQRRQRLKDDVIIIVVSVFLSTVVQYLIK